jgi:hypothetical protein
MSEQAPPKSGVQAARPSTCTKRLFANSELELFKEIAQVFAFRCGMSNPGTILSSSEIFVAPERRMPSGVRTKIAAAP